MRPFTLAVLSAGRIVVGDGSRLQLFDSLGTYLSEQTIPQRVVGMTQGCGDDVVVYGPGQRDETGAVPWLISYPTSDSFHVGGTTVLMRDTVTAARRGYGKKVVASDGQSLVIYDEYSKLPRLVMFDCDRLQEPVSVTLQSDNEVDENFTIKAGSSTFGGIAMVEGKALWMLRYLPATRNARGFQEFYLSDAEGTHQIFTTSDPVSLLDGRGQRILFKNLSDIPSARIVNLELLNQGAN